MFERILVPLDGSPLSQSALPYAVRLAQQFDSKLFLLRVVPPVSVPMVEYGATNTELTAALHEQQIKAADFYLDDIAHQPEIAALQPRILRREGSIAETILATAAEFAVDTIVMATHGRSGLARWVMGSVADRLMRSAPVPVLLVRAGMVDKDPAVALEQAQTILV